MDRQNTRAVEHDEAPGGSPPERDGDLAALLARARRLEAPGGRRLLGLTGPPGAGKSVLAAALVEALAPDAALVPMDGFHLAGAELARLGRGDRKGAPDTFDAAGYVALLRRLRDPAEDVVYAPDFRRDIEEPVAGAIPIPRRFSLVVTEGNYLLLADPPWSAARDLLDEVWYLEVPEPMRLERLVTRHAAYGKTPAEARAWALGSDSRNAELVARTRGRADLVVRCAST
jgi:pantothenate kinase